MGTLRVLTCMNKKRIGSNIRRLRKIVYVCSFEHSKKKYNNCYLIEGSIIICFYRTETGKYNIT